MAANFPPPHCEAKHFLKNLKQEPEEDDIFSKFLPKEEPYYCSEHHVNFYKIEEDRPTWEIYTSRKIADLIIQEKRHEHELNRLADMLSSHSKEEEGLTLCLSAISRDIALPYREPQTDFRRFLDKLGMIRYNLTYTIDRFENLFNDMCNNREHYAEIVKGVACVACLTLEGARNVVDEDILANKWKKQGITVRTNIKEDKKDERSGKNDEKSRNLTDAKAQAEELQEGLKHIAITEVWDKTPETEQKELNLLDEEDSKW
jgi:hypothetical protein